MTFVQFIKNRCGNFLIQYLNGCELLILFFTLKRFMKLSNSLFLDANQQKISMMDEFSFLQVIERPPEVRFKYLGSYPSDKVPHLTKYSSTINIIFQINSAPSNDRGEHSIMIARPYKTYY